MPAASFDTSMFSIVLHFLVTISLPVASYKVNVKLPSLFTVIISLAGFGYTFVSASRWLYVLIPERVPSCVGPITLLMIQFAESTIMPVTVPLTWKLYQAVSVECITRIVVSPMLRNKVYCMGVM